MSCSIISREVKTRRPHRRSGLRTRNVASNALCSGFKHYQDHPSSLNFYIRPASHQIASSINYHLNIRSIKIQSFSSTRAYKHSPRSDEACLYSPLHRHCKLGISLPIFLYIKSFVILILCLVLYSPLEQNHIFAPHRSGKRSRYNVI